LLSSKDSVTVSWSSALAQCQLVPKGVHVIVIVELVAPAPRAGRLAEPRAAPFDVAVQSPDGTVDPFSRIKAKDRQ
jgi:hypothetical protein